MSAAMRAGYKQTEVGVIPEDWDVVPLEACTSFISYGFTNPMPTVVSGVYMITAKDINFGKIQIDSARCTTEEAYRKLLTAKSRPEKDDLLLTKDGTLGRLALVEDATVCINQSVAILRPNTKTVPLFLKMLLEAPTYQSRMLADAGGSTIKHIYITIVNRMPIVCPRQTEEQRAIATALSDVDALLAKLDALIAKKRDLKVATMQQLLTGQTRLPGFSGEWEVKRLGDLIDHIADFTANGSFEALKTNVRYYDSRNFAVLVRTTDLDKSYFVPERFTDEIGYKYLSKTALFGGELVIANVGSIGKVFRVPTFDLPMTLAPNTYLLKSNRKTDETYLFHWMKTSEFYAKLMSKIGSSTLQAINKDNLRSIELSLPPGIQEQTAIAAVLNDMDTELTALEARRDKTRALKQGMMQELLTGRIRLVAAGE